MSNVSTPSAAKYVLIAFWGVFSDWLAEEEATRAWLMDGFARYAGTTQKQTAAALKPPSAEILKDTGNGNSPQWAELRAVRMVLQSVGKEKWLDV